MILAFWCLSFLSVATLSQFFAVDAGTVGIVGSLLSFFGAIIVAFLNGRSGGRGRRQDPALVAALADTQERLETVERERDRYKAELAGEKAARLSDLRALAEARGLADPAVDKPRRRRPAKG